MGPHMQSRATRMGLGFRSCNELGDRAGLTGVATLRNLRTDQVLNELCHHLQCHVKHTVRYIQCLCEFPWIICRQGNDDSWLWPQGPMIRVQHWLNALNSRVTVQIDHTIERWVTVAVRSAHFVP